MNFIEKIQRLSPMKIYLKRQKVLKSKLLYKGLLRNLFFFIFNPYTANCKIMTKFDSKRVNSGRKLIDQAKFGERFDQNIYSIIYLYIEKI